MSEQDKPFVINDRRKFRMDGEMRDPQPETETAAPERSISETTAPAGPVVVATPASGPIPINAAHTNSAHLVTPVPEPADEETYAADDEAPAGEALDQHAAGEQPPPPTQEEIEQVRNAYEATAERLDTMMRSQNLGGEYLPPMDFNRLVQSVYMSAMIQLGAGTQQGQQARVDILGAKQSIDMLGVIAEKTGTNLSEDERRLMDSALFELRMGFLEMTQLLSRQAAAKQAPPAPPTGSGGFGAGSGGFTGAGPRIVR